MKSNKSEVKLEKTIAFIKIIPLEQMSKEYQKAFKIFLQNKKQKLKLSLSDNYNRRL